MSYPGVEVKLDDVNKILKKRGLQTRGRVQRLIDSEVLRRSEPYTPLRKGPLRNSGTTNTDIGTGLVRWRTPYARRRYYEGKIGSSTGALRGPQWFERMKNVYRKQIIELAAKEAGGHT